MRRTKTDKKVLAILTSDWHLRDTQPICRTDDHWEAQWKKLAFIKAIQEQHGCVIIHAGDFFHHWKPSPNLLRESIAQMPAQVHTVFGNHDLPQRNPDLHMKSGLGVLIEAGAVELLCETDLIKWNGHWFDKDVLVWHTLTYTGKPPWPGCGVPTAEEIMKEQPMFDLILTGDNHKPFVVSMDDRFLVNPGSLTRQTADQDKHRPRVFLWYSDQVKTVYLPIEEGVVSREHLEKAQERDARIEAFVIRLGREWEDGISFQENLDRFAERNKVPTDVMRIIRKAIDE